MPIVSQAQRRAMWAAENGHSTLGIPKEVATKFLTHDFAALAANSAIPAGVRKLAVDADTSDDMTEDDWRGLLDGLSKHFGAKDEEPKTLYVHRKLRDGNALVEWAHANGFKVTLPPGDMHVTVAFSKAPVDWTKITPQTDILRHDIPEGDGDRSLERLGTEGAVVLRFESPSLQERWQEFRDAGATWDHDAYRPHVTITYDGADVDLDKIRPYDGVLEFDPEVFGEVKEGSVDRAKAGQVAADAMMAMDRAFNPTPDSRFEIAMDRDTVREKTRDGRLIVKKTNISKANVCPYRGQEIPGWEDLGLEPERVYNLLRDPDELAKAAPTLNGVQLLIKHIPVNADDHRPNETVGSLGTDAEFDGEHLTNSLFVNSRAAIDAIESGKQRELSAGYHYKPDMTAGNFRGTAYDGVMRNIVFNHVALVEDGRAGPDVVVADAALKENDMKTTRLGARTLAITAGAIAPLLAMDSKITLPAELLGTFKGLTTKNFKDNRAKLLSGVKLALDGKLKKGLALDGSIEKFGKALDAFIDDVNSGMDEPAPEEANAGIEAASKIEAPKGITEPNSTYDAEPLKSYMKQCGMDDEMIGKCMDMMPKNGLAGDEDDAEAKKKKEEEAAAAAAAKDAEMKDMVSKPAMDAALKAQAEDFTKQIGKVRDTERSIRVALDEVRPWVGELPATMAFDSAAAVVRHALTMKEHPDAKTLHADALMPILKTYPKIGARQKADAAPVIAMDSVKKALTMAPGLEHISTEL